MDDINHPSNGSSASGMKMKETENEIMIENYLPGYDENRLSVVLEGNQLIISGHKQGSSFQQSITVPSGFSLADIHKEYKQDFLNIFIIKKKKKAE